MKEYIKNVLKIIQIAFVLFIPLVVIQYYFPIPFLEFVRPFSVAAVALFSKFISLTINGTDWTVVFIIIPWVIGIILLGIAINVIDSMSTKIETAVKQHKLSESIKKVKKEEALVVDTLNNKSMTYLTLSVVFSRFTISSLSDKELEEKQSEVAQDLLKDLPKYKGNVVESDAFDDNNTYSILFATQEDALNFALKLNDLVKYYDDEIQIYGCSIAYKAILDSQFPGADQFNIFSFAEKALKTTEINELCATNDFAERYRKFGKLNHVLDFVSKGNYSINKEKVELNRVCLI